MSTRREFLERAGFAAGAQAAVPIESCAVEEERLAALLPART